MKNNLMRITAAMLAMGMMIGSFPANTESEYPAYQEVHSIQPEETAVRLPETTAETKPEPTPSAPDSVVHTDEVFTEEAEDGDEKVTADSEEPELPDDQTEQETSEPDVFEDEPEDQENGDEPKPEEIVWDNTDIPDGTGCVVEIIEEIPMFRMLSSDAVMVDNQIEVTIVTEGTVYDRIYLGSAQDERKTDYIKGTPKGSGYVFRFLLTAEYAGREVEFVPGAADGYWYTEKECHFTVPGLPDENASEAEDNGGSVESEETDAPIETGSDAQQETTDIQIMPETQDDVVTAIITMPVVVDELLGAETEEAQEVIESEETEGIEEESEEAPEELLLPEGDTAPLVDGDYNVEVESSASMFRVVACKLTAKGEKLSAIITLSGVGYDYLYMGTAEEAEKAPASEYIPFEVDADGKYTYQLPFVELDTPISVAARSKKYQSWYDRELIFHSETVERIQPKIDDGEYTVTVETGAAMFKVVACTLTAKGSKYSAVVKLSGQGYDYLFAGTSEQAEDAKDKWIPYVVDSDGKYTYAIDSVLLDTPMPFASHSNKNDRWYDRTMTFDSSTLVRSGDEDPDRTQTPSADATPTPTVAPSPTPEADLSGTTSKVDNSTGLADGTYTPDKFSFSGGTGRVKISCSKITVSGGKAYATIVFSSPNYPYVKANGQKIYGSHSGSASTFTIPIKLNANNTVIGMTTAMSQDHEVKYKMYFYLAAAEGQTTEETKETDAPKVPGLTFKSKDNIREAGLFGIYRYEGGLTLIKVENVGNFLIAPENAELPTGIEEDVVLLTTPVESAYVATETLFDTVTSITDAVKLVGFETQGDELKYAGSCYEPAYAALLSAGCDIAIVPETLSDARTFGDKQPENAAVRKELTEDRVEALADYRERMAMLGIPIFVDRSADELTEAASLEWIKVYGVIFGCEKQANAMYEQLT